MLHPKFIDILIANLVSLPSVSTGTGGFVPLVLSLSCEVGDLIDERRTANEDTCWGPWIVPGFGA